METTDTKDFEVAGRLRRLDAGARDPAPGFDYTDLLRRQEAGKVRTRRRVAVARGATGALVLAMLSVSAWRLAPRTHEVTAMPTAAVTEPSEAAIPQQRLVRADNYLALAAIEDHIANIDDAISMARLSGPAADVQRLERTRAELFDSYTQVRYAQMVAANF
jgi:hypothetical protein